MSLTNAIVLYDLWLIVGKEGAGLLDPLGTDSWNEAERVASVYREQARYTGHPHFQYIVHPRGSPPPQWEANADALLFGDSRLDAEGGERGTTLPPPPLVGTFLEEEILGEREPVEEGYTSEETAEEEEGLLAAFLQGKILHSVPPEEEEPDELYRQTWPYRHDFVPPSSSEQEQQETGGEEDDSLFFF